MALNLQPKKTGGLAVFGIAVFLAVIPLLRMLGAESGELRRQHDANGGSQSQADGASQLLVAAEHASLQVLALSFDDLCARCGFTACVGEHQIAPDALNQLGTERILEVLNTPRNRCAIDAERVGRLGE